MNKTNQLTGLRFIAALLVFASHSNWNNSNQIFIRIFDSGYAGVSIFFMLSGFVLAHSYQERIKNQRIDFQKYYLLRIIRLTPLHFLCTGYFIILSIFANNFDPIKSIINLLYANSWVPSSYYYFSLNSPSWSLSNEMFFYLIFFPIILLKTRHIIFVLLLLGSVVFISALYFSFNHVELKIFGEKSFSHWLFYIFPIFRSLEFILGIVYFRLWTKGYRLPGWLTWFSYLVLLMAMYFAPEVPLPIRLSIYFIPSVSLLFYSHLNHGTNISKILSNRVFMLLGSASFCFYLIHVEIINRTRPLLIAQDYSNTHVFIINLSITILLSILIYLFIETKIDTFLKNALKTHQSTNTKN